MRTILAALAVALFLTACGEATDPSPSAGEEDGSARSSNAPVTHFAYECAGAKFDPVTFRPGHVEEGADPKAAALRRLLSLFDAEGLPETGWTEVSTTAKKATFITRDEAGFFHAIIERDGSKWSESGWGQCNPRASIEGGSVLEWSLDPNAPSPRPNDTVIKALVNEIACHGFEDPTDRIRQPIVIYEPDHVLVAITADPLKGFQNCPGTPPVPFEFELSEPLGDRPLFDAGSYPPRRADEPPRSW